MPSHPGLTLACIFIGSRALWWITIGHAGIVTDSLYYFATARDLAAGLGYIHAGEPTAFFPVGYPALLAAGFWIAGPAVWVGVALNMILSAATVAMAWRLFRHWFAPEPAFYGALALILCPSFVLYSTLLLSDLAAGCFLVAAILCFVERRYLLCGVAFAACIFTRSQFILVPAMIAAALILAGRWRDALRFGVVVYGVAALAILPWYARNQAHGLSGMVSSNGCYNLYVGHYPGQIWGANWPLPDRLAAYDITTDARAAERDTAICGEALAHAWARVRDTPATALHLAAHKALRFLLPDRMGLKVNALQAADVGRDLDWLLALQAVVNVSHLALLAGVALLPFAWLMRRDMTGALILIPIAHGVIVSALVFGEGRFHVSVLPFFVAALVYGVASIVIPVRQYREATP